MKRFFLIGLVSILLASCSPTASNKRVIMVSIEPLRYFTNQIAGDKFEVYTMVQPGSNPETYEPTAQQMMALAKSDLFIKVGGLGFERTWMKKIESNAPHTIIINSSDGIIPIRTINGIEGPHTWMSCVNAVIIARNIYQSLAEIDSKDSLYFKKNLEDFISTIRETNTKVRENITRDKHTSFLIYHPALSYYAKEYGLNQIPIEEEGREPGPIQLKEIITMAKKRQVRTLFLQKEFANRNTKIIAKSVGAETVPINPLSYDWEKEMVGIAEKLK